MHGLDGGGHRPDRKAVDLDSPRWSQWTASADGGGPTPLQPGKDWVWREDEVAQLLSTEDADVLFVSGCASNQTRFHPCFDHIVLLSAPAAVMVERLTRRSNNSYGKHPEEVRRSLRFKETVEPKLRAIDHELNTSEPLDDVVEAIIDLVEP